MNKQEKARVDGSEHKLLRKWGKLNYRAGWVGFPSAVVQFQDQLRLSSAELNVLLQIADFWWDPERHPYPSKGLIAKKDANASAFDPADNRSVGVTETD